MKTIKIDLPQDLSQLEIHTFADEHFGDENTVTSLTMLPKQV